MDPNQDRKYRRNLPSQSDVFPQSKVTMRRSPAPDPSKDVIRLKFLEKPFRYYHSWSYHWQAFFKTVILSFVLIVPSYHFVYYIASLHAKAEIMGKMDSGFTSDNLKHAVIDYRRRQQDGDIETYEKGELYKELGESLRDNKGVAKKQPEMSKPKRSYF